MATKQLTCAPMRADHHRPTPLSVFRPTAPLPQPAVESLARLELAFLPMPVRKAVVRYRNASAVAVELSAVMDYRSLTVPEFNDLEFAQDTMRESRQILAAAGRLDLIGGAV